MLKVSNDVTLEKSSVQYLEPTLVIRKELILHLNMHFIEAKQQAVIIN